MLKKVLAIFLSMAMLISATSVFAALPSAGTFTTTTAGTIDLGTSGRAVDDFNRHTATATRFSGYVSKGTDVFYQHNMNYSTTGKVYTIDNLSDGNNAIGMTSDSSWTQTSRLYMCLDTLAMKPADNYKAVFKYDLRFTDLSATKTFQSTFRLATVVPSSTPLAKVNNCYSPGIQLSRNSDNDGYMLQYPESISAGKIDVVQDKWYTFYTIVDNTGKNSTIKCNTLIADRDTGEVLINYTFNRDLTSGDFFFRAVRMAKINAEEIGTASIKLQVDNAELAYYNETTYCPEIKNSSIAENYSEVISSQKTGWVQFDQSIATAGTAYIITPSNEKIVCTITKDSTKINTYNISWDSVLAVGDGYEIKFSGFKNSSGKSADCAIQFNVPEVPRVPVTFKKAELSDGTTLLDGADSVSVGESFKIYFDSDVIAPTAGTDVKLYPANAPESLVNIVISQSDDNKSCFTVKPVNNLLLATQYMLDFSGVLSSSCGVLEGDTKQIEFMTAGRDCIYESEDFENMSAGEYTGTIFNAPASSTVVDGTGYGTSRCIKLTGGNLYTTKAYEFDISEILWYEYKIKVIDTTDNMTENYLAHLGNTNGSTLWANPMQIRIDNMGKLNMSNHNLRRDYYIKQDYWYTVVVRYAGSTAQSYLYDEKGNMVLMCDRSATSQDKVTFYPIDSIRSGTEILLDDFKIYRTPAIEELEVNDIVTSSKNGKDYIMVQFNQPLGIQKEAEKETITLLHNDTEVPANVVYVGGGELRLFPEAGLKENTSYTVNISNAKALSGNSAANRNIDVKTAKLYDIKITETSLLIENGNIEAGDKTVFFENSGSSLNGDMLAAVYSNERPGRLLGIEILENCQLNSATGNVTLNFSKNYSNVGFVDIFIYDSLGDFNAMAQIYRIN